MSENTPNQASLFPRGALDKASSPDELDRLMHVTHPKGWLALIALVLLVLGALLWGVIGTLPITIGGQQGVLLHAGARHLVVTPVSGLVTDVAVAPGYTVAAGQTIATVQVGSGQVEVKSLFSGHIDELFVSKGLVVKVGAQLAIVEAGAAPLQVIALVPIDTAKELSPGMTVHVSPSTANADDFGFMWGRVDSVSEFPLSRQQAEDLFLNESLVDTLFTTDNQLQVIINLVEDSSTPTGYQWSTAPGPPFQLSHGTLCTVTFVIGEQHPINLVLPSGVAGAR